MTPQFSKRRNKILAIKNKMISIVNNNNNNNSNNTIKRLALKNNQSLVVLIIVLDILVAHINLPILHLLNKINNPRVRLFLDMAITIINN